MRTRIEGLGESYYELGVEARSDEPCVDIWARARWVANDGTYYLESLLFTTFRRTRWGIARAIKKAEKIIERDKAVRAEALALNAYVEEEYGR